MQLKDVGLRAKRGAQVDVEPVGLVGRRATAAAAGTGDLRRPFDTKVMNDCTRGAVVGVLTGGHCCQPGRQRTGGGVVQVMQYGQEGIDDPRPRPGVVAQVAEDAVQAGRVELGVVDEQEDQQAGECVRVQQVPT